MNTVLAIDLGGTKTSAAVIDSDGRAVDRRKLPAEHSLDRTVSRIADIAAQHEVAAVGVIVPGIFDSKTGSAWAPNLWGWDHQPLREQLQRTLRVPIAIAGDRAGYVLGEHWLGAARGLDDVVFVAVGTGIGVGIMSGGRVWEGAHGIAGAAGWMAISREWKSEYAQCGCWEAEAAGPAVARRARMGNAEAVVAAARRGETAALRVLEETADVLAAGIANLLSILDPQIVVLGGGLMQAGDLLIERIRATVPRWAQPVAAKLARIELTQLGEDAGLYGAARLAFLRTADSSQ